jgi:hypothetical protein
LFADVRAACAPPLNKFPERHLHRKISLIMANQGRKGMANQSRTPADWRICAEYTF